MGANALDELFAIEFEVNWVINALAPSASGTNHTLQTSLHSVTFQSERLCNLMNPSLDFLRVLTDLDQQKHHQNGHDQAPNEDRNLWESSDGNRTAERVRQGGGRRGNHGLES